MASRSDTPSIGPSPGRPPDLIESDGTRREFSEEAADRSAAQIDSATTETVVGASEDFATLAFGRGGSA